MQRSKLELYEEVIAALAEKPMTVDAIAYACDMDCVALSKRLNFLVKNNLVEERKSRKEACYALTKRGMAIFKTLEITRRLEKLQTSFRIIERTLQAIPSLSENGKEKTTNK